MYMLSIEVFCFALFKKELKLGQKPGAYVVYCGTIQINIRQILADIYISPCSYFVLNFVLLTH